MSQWGQIQGDQGKDKCARSCDFIKDCSHFLDRCGLQASPKIQK